MSDRAPYSRVYWSVIEDPKFVGIYDDDAAFALWTRLLISADALWPAPAPVPRTARPKPLAKLVDAGLIDLLSGDRYKVHGLDAERGRRRDAAKTGGNRPPSGTQTGTGRVPDGSPARAIAETSRDEQHRDEQPAREGHDPWNDPEHEALVWLAKHGCDVRPGNGYHRKLVTAVEVHGVNALIGMMDRLADAGTKHGDVKGFLFGAIDALDSRNRPSLKALEAADRDEERGEDFARRVARTRERTADLRAVLEAKEK